MWTPCVDALNNYCMPNNSDSKRSPSNTNIHCRTLSSEKARLLRAAHAMKPQMTLTSFIMHAAHAKADSVLRLAEGTRDTYKAARAKAIA